MNEERTGKCLRQVKHIRGHLLNISKNYKYYLFFPKAVIIPLTRKSLKIPKN